MTLPRRSFLTGLIGLVAAPAVIRTPGVLMPVRAIPDGLIVPTATGLEHIKVWSKVLDIEFETARFFFEGGLLKERDPGNRATRRLTASLQRRSA